MSSLKERIKIEEEKLKVRKAPASSAELETYRIEYLGAKGILKSLSVEMKDVPADQKKEVGEYLNQLRGLSQSFYDEHKAAFGDQGKKGPAVDVTLPGNMLPAGTRH